MQKFSELLTIKFKIMSRVKAFRGLRPPVEIAAQLASRPYDVMNSAEARVEAAGNQYSLLHVTKAEIDLAEGIDETLGRGFYPEDLQVEEFHEILNKMLDDGETEEVKKILNQRSIVIRDGKKLKAVDYTDYFKEEFKDLFEDENIDEYALITFLESLENLISLKYLLENKKKILNNKKNK